MQTADDDERGATWEALVFIAIPVEQHGEFFFSI